MQKKKKLHPIFCPHGYKTGGFSLRFFKLRMQSDDEALKLNGPVVKNGKMEMGGGVSRSN